MSELIFEHEMGDVLFESEVVTTLKLWRQDKWQPEAGGILIGFRRPPHLHIIACTTPMKRDKRSRLGFNRLDPGHMATARQYWKCTSGQAYYLGDWHTHPEDNPAPSFIDKLGWRKMKKSNQGPDVMFVIVGRSNWYLQRGC